MVQLGPAFRGRESPVLRRTIPWANQWGQLDGSWASLAAPALKVARAGRWVSVHVPTF
jgi:hypothetical protein